MTRTKRCKLWSIANILLLLLLLPSCKDHENFPDAPPIEEPQVPPVTLSINTQQDSQLNLSVSEDSVYTITGKTGNTDPYFFINKLESDAPEECCVLEFNYTLTEDIDNFEIFFIDP